MPKYIIKERYTEQVQGVRVYEVEAASVEEAHLNKSLPCKLLEERPDTCTILNTETFAIQLAQ